MIDPRIEKRNKLLNYAIITCCAIILVLAAFYFTAYGTDGIFGNSVYDGSGKYDVGEVVEYANTNWYVVSENNKSYTLLKQSALTAEEINSLGVITSIDGTIPYDVNDNCSNQNTDGCSISMESSTIGKILTSWQKKVLNIDDLITVDDYTIRLINLDDINRLKNYDWLYLDKYYWTMSSPNYSNFNIYGLDSDHNTYIHMVYDGANETSGGLVRPVINLKKKFVK